MKQKYAKLIIKKGLNLQKGQPLLITAPIEVNEFVKLVVEEAYKVGAKTVEINWIDPEITKLKYKYEPIENFKEIQKYIIDKNKDQVTQNYAFLKISALSSDALKGIDVNKLQVFNQTMNENLKFKDDALMNDELSWCVVSVPTKKWAKEVLPNSENPVEDLWQLILNLTYCDQEDPEKFWDEHIKKLEQIANKLNNYNLDKLIFKNKKGTNLEVGLIDGYKFIAAESINKKLNNHFIANIPSEEVFSAPNKSKINGIVYNTKPLNYQGNLIDDFYLEFKNGQVVNYEAKIGKKILKSIIESDLGSKSLGEVALVNNSSRINKTDLLFYNTLYDENASCHIALGKGYPTCVDEKINPSFKNLNDSSVHVDFMFGSDDLKVFGIDKNNQEIKIMENGEFII